MKSFKHNHLARCECELVDMLTTGEKLEDVFPICTHYEQEEGNGGLDICVACRHGEDCHLSGGKDQ